MNTLKRPIRFGLTLLFLALLVEWILRGFYPEYVNRTGIILFKFMPPGSNIFLAGAALFGISYLYRKEYSLVWGTVFLWSGWLANLFSWLTYGGYTDYLYFYWWYSNLPDLYITAGLAIFINTLLFKRNGQKQKGAH